MAVPTPPTVDSILTEAFRRCGIPSPDVSQKFRGENEWFEESKRELMDLKRWHDIEETMVVIPQAYVHVVPIPTPLQRVLRVRFYDGDVKGVATAGGASTITIALNAGGDLPGRKIYLTSGTGAAQSNRIIAYVPSTGLVTVSCPWDTIPAAGTGYMVANLEVPLRGPEISVPSLGTGTTNLITHYEEYEGNLHLYPIPNASTYALEVDGIVDVSLVDKTNVRLTGILRDWRTAMIYGVMLRIATEEQDFELVDRLGSVEGNGLYGQAARLLMKADSRRRRGIGPVAMKSVGGMPRRRTH